MSVIKKSIRKITNKIRAMPAACRATPVNPKKAATSATARNMRAHLNIAILLFSAQ